VPAALKLAATAFALGAVLAFVPGVHPSPPAGQDAPAAAALHR
jgi:hypothetical protein